MNLETYIPGLKLVQELGLTKMEVKVLLVIQEHGKMTAQEVIDATGMSGSRVRTLLNGLKWKKMISISTIDRYNQKSYELSQEE